MPKLENKPGRFWGVINRKCLKLGKRRHFELTEKQAVQLRRLVRRYRRANTKPERRRWLFKGGLSSKEFSVKLYCNADFWLERLPRLLENFSCNFLESAVFNQSGTAPVRTQPPERGKMQPRETGKRSIEAETVTSELHFPQNNHPLHHITDVPCSARGDNFNNYV